MNRSNEHVKQHREQYKRFVQWARWYPDLFLDLITPKEGGIRLDLDQRVFMRVLTRFASTYAVFPRAYGKCVAGDTLLFTEEGMKEIGEYFDYCKLDKEAYIEIDEYLVNRYGSMEYSHAGVYNGYKKTKKIRTKAGFELECSLNHKILVRRGSHDYWIKSEDLKIGDRALINLHNDVWGYDELTSGNIRRKYFKKTDDYTREIPKEVLKCNALTFIRYIVQLFDKLLIKLPDRYELVGLSNKLGRQVQLVFLNLGIVLERKEDRIPISIELYKQIKKWVNEMEPIQSKKVNGDYYIDDIVELEDSENYVYDISLRETHSYVSNGLISHNTFIEILTMFVSAILYPNLELFLTAQTKANASQILKQKHNEIVKFYPLFKNEIMLTKFSETNAEIRFTNGSWIQILANAQSSKGNRCHRLNLEESALVDAKTFEDALKPIPDIPRRTIGKNAEVNPYEPNGQINFLTTAGFKGTSEFDRIKGMLNGMAKDSGEAVITANWELALYFGRGLTKAQILRNKEEMSPIAFDQNYESIWVGASDMALVDIKNIIECRNLRKPEFKTDGKSEYIVSVDVARSENIKNNNQTYVVVLKIKRRKDGTVQNVQCVYMKAISGDTTFENQAIAIKQIVNDFDAKTVVVDRNGLGVGLCDEMKKEQICKETGVIYDAYRNVPILPNGTLSPYQDDDEKLYEMVATGINSQIIVNFQNYTIGKKYSLLTEDYDKSFQVDGFSMNSEILPYIETDFLISELLNLQAIPTSKGLIVKRVARKIDKDRYSALAYGLYYIENFENNYNFKTEEELLEYMFIN